MFLILTACKAAEVREAAGPVLTRILPRLLRATAGAEGPCGQPGVTRKTDHRVRFYPQFGAVGKVWWDTYLEIKEPPTCPERAGMTGR